jgi:hypothetical protein
MSELRARARVLYNALNFDKPVNFGLDELIAGLDADKYVENLHGEPLKDPVQELADQIDLSDSAGAYLFTGNRGTGKTTELLRLATIPAAGSVRLRSFLCRPGRIPDPDAADRNHRVLD